MLGYRRTLCHVAQQKDLLCQRTAPAFLTHAVDHRDQNIVRFHFLWFGIGFQRDYALLWAGKKNLMGITDDPIGIWSVHLLQLSASRTHQNCNVLTAIAVEVSRDILRCVAGKHYTVAESFRY